MRNLEIDIETYAFGADGLRRDPGQGRKPRYDRGVRMRKIRRQGDRAYTLRRRRLQATAVRVHESLSRPAVPRNLRQGSRLRLLRQDRRERHNEARRLLRDISDRDRGRLQA